MAQKPKHRPDPYRWLAPIYERIESLYSGGAIGACKRRLIDRLTPGERLLFIGSGSGGDALYAAQKGMRVSLCDTSPAMLAKAHSRFLRAGLPEPERLLQPWQELSACGVTWPNIAAHFFLNLYPASELAPVLAGMTALLAPGGRLLIADFAPFRGPWIGCQKAHWYLPLLVTRAVTGDLIHPVVDYRDHLAAAGLKITYRKDIRAFGLGPAWYRAILAQKPIGEP